MSWRRWDDANVIPGLNLTDVQYKCVVKAGIDSLLTPTRSSWLEQLFVQKCRAVYPELIDHPSSSLDPLAPTMFGVVGDEALCRYQMAEYLRTFRAYTGNACLWEYQWDRDLSCRPNGQLITWSVRNGRASGQATTVTYPSDTAHNLRTWRAYFVRNRIWGDGALHERFNLYWRNILVPAHEIIHLFATHGAKFAYDRATRTCERTMTHDDVRRRSQTVYPVPHTHPSTDVVYDPPSDRADAYHDEWTASVANANVFILHMRHYYQHASNPRHRAIYQLHVVQGLLYIVTLIHRIRQSVQAIEDVDARSDAQRILRLGEQWTLLSIARADDVAKVVHIVTNGGWPNTYLKHVSALMYAIAFFAEDDSSDFIQSLLTADIWRAEVHHAYRRKTMPVQAWMHRQSRRAVAPWIVERPDGLD